MMLGILSNAIAIAYELVLVYSLYKSYQILQNMKDDLDYATARIFLSPESVKGIKVLMAALVTYGFFNAAAVFTLSGTLIDVVTRFNLLYLFTGWAYFLIKISSITAKPE